MNAAKVYSELSCAKRLKVGAVIVRDNRIVSIGYNGTPTGRDNLCEESINDELVTKPEVIHAEANAILYAAKEGIKTDGCLIYTTHSPCYDCAKMIVQSGINTLYFETKYRDMSSVDFLIECGIKVIEIKE